ncbi:MAG: hypothetical protein KUG61_09550 [Parvibaculaceae bacterium]|nr:hypothetical protein [Parvibaculaceae bacterium]
MSDTFIPYTQATAAAEMLSAASAFLKALTNFDGAADEKRSNLIMLLHDLIGSLETPASGETSEAWHAKLPPDLSREKAKIDFFFLFMENTAGNWNLTDAGQKVAQIRQSIEGL